MDPAVESITSGALGWDFALAKFISAMGIGLFGGVVTMIFAIRVVFEDPLRENPEVGERRGIKAAVQYKPKWSFWRVAERVKIFNQQPSKI